MKAKSHLVLLAAALLLAALAGSSCKKDAASGGVPAKKGAPSAKSRIEFPVEVAPVATRSLIYTINAVGSIDAFEKVQATCRVSGVVDRVLFAEGNMAAVNQVHGHDFRAGLD